MVYLYNPDRKGLSEVQILKLEPWRIYPREEELNNSFLKLDNKKLLKINKETKIASIGSCFAREIKKWLIHNDYSFIQTASGPGTEPGSARYDRVYNTFTILQEFKRAFQDFSPVEKYWEYNDGEEWRLLDPYRRMIAWENKNEMEFELKEHKNNVYQAFTTCDVLIITVGQSEIWYNKVDGSVYPLVPPTQIFNKETHSFRQSTFEENLSNLNEIRRLYNKFNPNGKIIITVSPVPLRATFQETNSVIANVANKSMLRAAVETFVKDNSESVFYFPAYEIVTLLEEDPYEIDNRHVKKETVDEIMSLFESYYVVNTNSNHELFNSNDVTRRKINYFLSKASSELDNNNLDKVEKILNKISFFAANELDFHLISIKLDIRKKDYYDAENKLLEASKRWKENKELKNLLIEVKNETSTIKESIPHNAKKNHNVNDDIVFIGGAGRSGTTLLRVMLNAHHRFASGPEFKAINNIIEVYNQIKNYKDIRKSYDISDEILSNSFSTLIASFFENFRIKNQAARIVEKTPHNVLVMKELAEIFPKAKFIHVVRDGRDVASSLVNMKWVDSFGNPVWYVKDIRNAAKYWNIVVRKGLEDASLPILNDRVKLIKYEDLILHTEDVMKDILAFLDEDWDPNVLQYHQIERGEEPVESSTNQVSKQINSKALKRWKKTYNSKDKEEFKSEAGKLLTELGYESNTDW